MNRHKQTRRKNQNRKQTLNNKNQCKTIDKSSTNGRGTAPPSENSRKSSHRDNIQSLLRSIARDFLPSAAAILTLLLLTASSSFARSATWKQRAATDDWFTATNWRQHTVPNGPRDTAMFETSNQTSIDIFAKVEVNGIMFKPGASAFTIATNPQAVPEKTVSGVGITNNSGIVQNFVVNRAAAQILFLHSATAGSLTADTSLGSITFGITSTAGNATFNNNAVIFFDGSSTAGNGTFTNHGLILADRSTFRAGSNTFQVNYKGGDGNDLTLTVVR